MKKIVFIILVILISFDSALAQVTSCDQLIDYVNKNGSRKDRIDSALNESSWLKKVESFTIENSIVVIAELYTDEHYLNSKKYIFCNVPEMEWDAFNNNRKLLLAKSLGELFHEYIYEFKCNCD